MQHNKKTKLKESVASDDHCPAFGLGMLFLQMLIEPLNVILATLYDKFCHPIPIPLWIRACLSVCLNMI